ncbi:DUF4375 domain-containing protein [Roseisolibacter sp. H3M3-2]|uniref:DMP19 family protein n=1 Tax=Roseisolibacter sp. H3M3-2 TaxID=3031323 RepID=UPI0023D9D5AD|nr:DUF4375 domain-containing protein [Roseisolibacter sp. H3M3-2]MDF1503618.1 DUF4375 domain-containing protein [Roseisolibacter sp. H3M3-2]
MDADLRVPAGVLAEDGDDATSAWRVIAPAWDAVRIHDGPDVLAAGLARLTPGQRALLAIHWCVSETLNGGFDQFLTNPSGLLADEAQAGFARVGVPEAARLLAAARVVFASRPPDPDRDAPGFDEAEDADAFDAYRARHAPLEERFYALEETGLHPPVAAYVRAHPTEFFR